MPSLSVITNNDAEGEKEEQPDPPLPPPEPADPGTPAIPTLPDRVLPHLRVKDLTSNLAVNLQKTAALFMLAVNKKAHTMADGRPATRLVWIEICNAVYLRHATEPGPLTAHKTFDGKEGQNKLKKILLEAAAYYTKQATTRQTGDEAFGPNDDSNNMQLVINCKHLGSQLHNERELALRVRKEQSVAAAEAKEKHKRAMEAAEGFMGAVPACRGVDAPSGVVLDADVEEGLCLLGAQPISRPPVDMDLSQEDLEDNTESVKSVEVTAVISPAKAPLVYDNYFQERRNAELTAKASAEHAEKEKAKKKGDKGKKKGSASRAFPGHTDLVDICDGLSKEMSKQSEKVTDLLGGLLPTLTNNNTQPAPQKTKATIMADVKQCNNMINGLKEDIKRAREEGDQAKVADCGERINRYKRMRRDLEAQLFDTQNEVVL